MKTTTRGLLTELRVQVRLAELGAHLFVPLGHDSPVDLLAYVGGRVSRIQIKTMHYARSAGKPNGTLTIPFYSIVDRVGGKVSKVLTRADCDVVIGFHPETEKFYVAVPTGRARIALRIIPALNNNTKLVNLAVDYELTSLNQLFPGDMLSGRIELPAFALPKQCSTTELRQLT